MTPLDLFTAGSAEISDCGRYRYSLVRAWNLERRRHRVAWVMLNPSTADASHDDATLKACLDFSRRWRAGSLEVVNLFAYRSFQPDDLLTVDDPVGPDNEQYVYEACHTANLVVFAWGAWPTHHPNVRGVDAVRIAWQLGKAPLCVGLTAGGQPRHPLYMKRDTPLAKWSPP